VIGYESRNLETGIDVTSGGEKEMRRGESKKWNPVGQSQERPISYISMKRAGPHSHNKVKWAH
jgi:hypothetical protein